MFKSLSRRIVVTAMCLGMTIAATGRIQAQDAKEKDAKSLALLTMMKGYDLKCHALNAYERKVMNGFALEMIKNFKIADETKERMRTLWKEQEAIPDLDCEQAKALFSDGIEMFRKMAVEAEAAKQENDPEWILKAVKKVINDLPKGRIAHLAGCYAGKQDEWSVEYCLTPAENVTLKFVHAKSGVVCDLSVGEARKRESGFYFYATNAKRQCSDGSRLMHAEGMCEELPGGIGCQYSAYKVENTFYVFRGSKAVLNGQVQLNKVTKKP
jgi:hypothetical protein